MTESITSYLASFIICLSVLTLSGNATHTTPAVLPILNKTVTVVQRDTTKQEIVQEVNKYITSKFPKSKLSAKVLVDACLEHNFDICFALAQAQIESGFGTAGRAKHTNSVWNVMTHKFTHPDLSVVPYINLVQTKYLGEKRTIDDLMKNYVSLSGVRYASNRSYERELRSTYNRICNQTRIKELQYKGAKR